MSKPQRQIRLSAELRTVKAADPLHREEEPHNYQETPGRQTKQINQLSLNFEFNATH